MFSNVSTKNMAVQYRTYQMAFISKFAFNYEVNASNMKKMFMIYILITFYSKKN